MIGEQVIQTEGKQVPFEYKVEYDPGDIQDNHSYTMMVRITDGAGNLLFINDNAIPVITRDNPPKMLKSSWFRFSRRSGVKVV